MKLSYLDAESPAHRELILLAGKATELTKTFSLIQRILFVDMLQAKEIYQEVKNLEKVFETTLNCQKGKNETEKIVESDP